jgi:hypothetical protein
MWDSYHDILDANSKRHHVIGSAILMLAVIGVLIYVFV